MHSEIRKGAETVTPADASGYAGFAVTCKPADGREPHSTVSLKPMACPTPLGVGLLPSWKDEFVSRGPRRVYLKADAGVGSETAKTARNVAVGSHCAVHGSARLHEGVIVDDYCRIGARTVIGARTRVLYGALIYADVTVGEDCVIGGFIPDRVVIESNVTCFATIAHTYLDATIPWSSIEEPSATIRRGAVVGMGALIVGPVEVGPGAYVAAGERVTHDVPANHLLRNGQLEEIEPNRRLKSREYWVDQ